MRPSLIREHRKSELPDQFHLVEHEPRRGPETGIAGDRRPKQRAMRVLEHLGKSCKCWK